MTSSTAGHTEHLSVDHRELSSLVFSGGQYIAEFHQNRRHGLSPEERRANANFYVAAPELLAALTFLMEVTEPPERNCSCHISPPCGWCVEYSQVAEAHEQAKAAIAKATGAA